MTLWRDDKSESHLLKVEVVMEGPTYFIVFGDAGEVPPPFRIDNLAEVCTVAVVTEILSTFKCIQHSNWHFGNLKDYICDKDPNLFSINIWSHDNIDDYM